MKIESYLRQKIKIFKEEIHVCKSVLIAVLVNYLQWGVKYSPNYTKNKYFKRTSLAQFDQTVKQLVNNSSFQVPKLNYFKKGHV